MDDVTKIIEIDAGHRISTHGSKCRNLHGHRWRIAATCAGELGTSGEQTGMVLDFSFLKRIMMEEIDAYCDHVMILNVTDPFFVSAGIADGPYYNWADIVRGVATDGALSIAVPNFGKFYIVPFEPTSENLAIHWMKRMKAKVWRESNSRATLRRVRVYETPNGWATHDASE